MEIEIILGVKSNGEWAAVGKSKSFSPDIDEVMDYLGCPFAGEVQFHSVRVQVPEFSPISSVQAGVSSPKKLDEEFRKQLFEDYPKYD